MLQDKIKKIININDESLGDFCIYATGSYARLEASEYSDIDLFFITSGTATKNALPKLQKILIDSELIKLARNLQFPDFSNDGEFLEIHYLDDIKENLGTPNDDFKNYFTARMLLLLESTPLYNESFYNTSLNEILDTYLRDYDKHNDDFKPMFLVNDIVRFWKTLCLNYEAKRNKFTEDTPNEKVLKSNLKNYKLYFSRKMTCYSFIIRIASIEGIITKETLLDICKETPLRRLENLAKDQPEQNDIIQQILQQYDEFLKNMADEESKLLEWMKVEENKQKAQLKGKEFGANLFKLLSAVCEKKPEILQYLVI